MPYRQEVFNINPASSLLQDSGYQTQNLLSASLIAMQNAAIAEPLARYDGSFILPQLLSSEAVASAMMTDLWHRDVAVVSLLGSVSAV
jgi:hypothetical protein